MGQRALVCEKIFAVTWLYKKMLLNEVFGFQALMARFKIKLLETMSQGLMLSFFIFCDLCPELVMVQLHPEFQSTSNAVPELKTMEQLERMLNNVLLRPLVTAHWNKWDQFMLPQIRPNLS